MRMGDPGGEQNNTYPTSLSGLGGESKGTLFRLADLELDSIHARDVVAVASSDERGAFADPHVAGIIGGDFLRRYCSTSNYPHSRVILGPTPRAAEPFNYDASGLFLVAEGRDLSHIRVLRVIPGSPASAVGLRLRDTILSLDGTRPRT
jgi:hypothetical protein